MEEVNQELEDLKAEATSLRITFSKNIGAVKLKEKIDAHYKAQETSGPAVEELVKKEELVGGATAVKRPALDTKLARRVAREKAAKATRIITLVDNDQRVNSHVNTCTVNCSNEFFDLGTKVLPLNEKIEVCQGHINVLKSVKIPLHVKNKGGLASIRMRPRYTISYEDAK